MKRFKLTLLVALTFMAFIYIVEGTRHDLIIPQDVDGEAVTEVTNAELEDDVGYLLKIPLGLFPRVLCLKNSNKVYSDGIAISRREFPEAGNMRLYVEKNGNQIIRRFDASVGKTLCEPVDLISLEGATTTANYTQAGFIKFETDTNGSTEVIGAHPTGAGTFQANINVDVSKSQLWVGFNPVVNLLLLFLSFSGVSAAILAVVELLKRTKNFICEDQLFRGF
ncbi:MAG: hypothetical protein WC790_01230 [Candidatus Paceibacterota bacterium]|jgi:hypothetical protein